MNWKAVGQGLLLMLKIMAFGLILSVLILLWPWTEEINGTGAFFIFIWTALLGGSAASGAKAGRSGWLHGGTVGFLFWLGRILILAWFLPALLRGEGELMLLGEYIIWGAAAGVAGVNWSILKRHEKARAGN